MPQSPPNAHDQAATSQAEKLRLRRERLEKWRKEREARAKRDATSGAQTLVSPTTSAAGTELTPLAPEPDTTAATIEHTPAQPVKAASTPPCFSLKSHQTTPRRLGFAWKNSAAKSTLSGSASNGQARSSGRVKLNKAVSSAFADIDGQENDARKRPRLPLLPLEVELDAAAPVLAGTPTDPSTPTSSDFVSATATEALAMDIEPVNGAPDEKEDSLEAFMADVNQEVEEISKADQRKLALLRSKGTTGKPRALLDGVKPSDATSLAEAAALDSDAGSDGGQSSDSGGDTAQDILALASKRIKRKELPVVDHSQIAYEPFQKEFYIEPAELRQLTADEVAALRQELDGIKVRGVNCPKPIKRWTQFGLPARCTEIIKKLEFTAPTPIQAQAIPAVLAGRDVIGVAKTGSGKTLAFLLPMFRHIKAQRPLEPGEGPIALLMTPTRELAVQIHRECKWFAKALGLHALCAYGGSPIKENIAELKRGAEIVVCTPGRMIDLLCANSGRLTNLQRVTYLVLDEADRMFDMGFEPQVMRIVKNVRPDRQTVLFSATFPRQMEALARKILRKPVEITVGGRSVVCSDVTQYVEVLADDASKFLRLQEILGQYITRDQPDARCLIFVDRQEAADQLLRELMQRGYLCASLHGGKDQMDRESAVADFKRGNVQVLIATSVAARGLDVKNLNLVINYECPNHMEDYVHRVGRTGRAGNKGDAYTFLTPEQDRYAADIVKALTLSKAPVPPEVQTLADAFKTKVQAGHAHYSGSGFGGKGLEKLDKDRAMAERLQKKAFGEEDDEGEGEGKSDDDDDGPGGKGIMESTRPTPAHAPYAPKDAPSTGALAPTASAEPTAPHDPTTSAAVDAARKAAAKVAAQLATEAHLPLGSVTGKPRDIVAEINAQFAKSASATTTAGGPRPSTGGLPSSGATTDQSGVHGGRIKGTGPGGDDHRKESAPIFSFEIEINDFPQKARWRVTNKDQIAQISEHTGAAITTRGTYYPPGKQPQGSQDERKLYLFVESHQRMAVEKARTEIKRILTETTIQVMESESRSGAGPGTGEAVGRYTVL
ncbi:pre-mRNA processing RNA-helicase [Dimargaris xerosporica]|nr:pre-mRNA processing RNA-helicase [Dimargaris xerosporica]